MSDFDENIEVINSVSKEGIQIDIVQFKKINGALSTNNAFNIFLLKESNMHLKQVRIKLNNSKVFTEAGALYFMKGDINCSNKIGGVGGFISKVIKGSINKEPVFNPLYEGTGEMWLEPRFGHFLIVNMKDESIIVDKGMFYCCTEGLTVKMIAQNDIATGMLGGEGFFQTKIEGTGICILESHVPESEIKKINLYNEQLQVDGNFAILRTENIKFNIKKSSKSIVGTLTNGEGLLQTFYGTGEVWLAPTIPVYESLENSNMQELIASRNISG